MFVTKQSIVTNNNQRLKPYKHHFDTNEQLIDTNETNVSANIVVSKKTNSIERTLKILVFFMKIAVTIFNLLFLVLAFTIEGISQTIPTSGLQLHLKADAGISSSNDSVNVWADQSGNGHDGFNSHADLTRRPVLVSNSINGEPAIRFNGGLTYLQLPTASDLEIQNSDYEIFIVSRSASVHSNTQFLIAGNSERYELHLNGSAGARFIPKSATYIDEGSIGDYTDTEPHLYNIRATDTYGSITVDFTNSTQTSVDAQTSDSGPLYLGIRANNTLALNGDIAEVLIYSSVLSESSRDSIETYINNKYDIGEIDPPSFGSLSFEESGESSAEFTAIVETSGTINYRVLWGGSDGAFIDSTEISGGTAISTDTVSYEITGLSDNTAYYVRLRAISSSGSYLSDPVALFFNNTTLPTDSLSLWLSADNGLYDLEDGESVSLWYDMSGKGTIVSQSNASKRPVIDTDALNGKPVIYFSGSKSLTSNTLDLTNTDYDIFVVSRRSGSDYEYVLSNLGGNNYPNLGYYNSDNDHGFQYVANYDNDNAQLFAGEGGEYSDNTFRVFNATATNSSGQLKVNSVTQSSDDSKTFWNDFTGTWYIGSFLDYHSYLTGDIAEIIIYNRRLTNAERNTVHHALSDKYDLGLPLGTPTQQVSDLLFTTSGVTTAKLSFSPGNGSHNLVLVKAGGAVDESPADSSSYTASNTFGEGTELGTGNFVVNAGSDTTITISGLTPGTTYHAAVFSYNGDPGFTKYLTTSPGEVSLALPTVAYVTDISPTPYSLSNADTVSIQVTFSNEMQTGSFFEDSSFIIRGSESGLHSGTLVFTEGNTVATFTSDDSFVSGETVTVTLSDSLQGAGISFEDPRTYSFTIKTNASSGTFSKLSSIDLEYQSSGIYATDLDGDGDVDVVSVDNSSYATVYLNQGDGSFATGVSYTAGDGPFVVKISDLDNDGDSDLILLLSDSAVSILMNNGDGTFATKTEYSTDSSPNSMDVADLNNDGFLDIIVGRNYNISIFNNNGDGTFAAREDHEIEDSYDNNGLDIGDLNGDGYSDIAVVDEDNDNVYLLINNKDETFTYAELSENIPYYPTSVLIADFDGDGDGDVAVGHDDDSELYLFRNNGSGSFSDMGQPNTYYDPENIIALNADGDTDIDVIGINSQYFWVMPNSGSGEFSGYTEYNIGSSIYGFYASDMDNDGDSDLILSTSDSLFVYKNITYAPLSITGTEGWRMMASPAGNINYSSLLSDIWTQGFTGASSESGTSNVYYWDKTSTDTSSSNWVSINSLNSQLSSGAGTLVYVFSDDNGPLVSGDAGFPKEISVPGASSPSDRQLDSLLNENEDGWALLGNPYYVTVDWDDFSKESLTNSVYVYDHNASGWKSWNGSSGSLTNGKIEPFEAFFVQTEYSYPELYIYYPDEEEETYDKAVQSEQVHYFSIELSSETGYKKDAWFQFSENASTDIDSYDAHLLKPLSTRYTLLGSDIGGNSLLEINNQPYPEDELIIPLYFESTEAGSHQLKLGTMNVPEGWEISLIDHSTEQVIGLEEPFFFNQPIKKNKLSQVEPGALLNPVLKAKTGRTTQYSLLVKLSGSTGNEPGSNLPETFALDQNYPNPFNPSTVIRYQLPVNSEVSLKVFDVLGREVASLIDGRMEAGYHQITFNARDLASGMYIYRLQTGNTVITKKLTLIK